MTKINKLKRDIIKYFVWAIVNSKYLQELRDNIILDVKQFNNLLLKIKPSDINIHYGDIENNIDKNLFNICKIIFNDGVHKIKYKTFYKSGFIRSMLASIYTIHNEYLNHFLYTHMDTLSVKKIKEIYILMNNNVFINN